MKAVIFDVDGVISDTQKIHARLEAEMLAQYGVTISPEELTRRFSGVSGHEMFSQIFRDADIECPDTYELSDRKAARFLECADEVVEIPGTREVVVQLRERGFLLAIASASRWASIEMVLKKLELLECFDAIASSKEVARGKPASDVFLLAARRLSVDPKECIVIEDGVSGMIAARVAGMRCVALAQNGQENLPADLVVDDLRKVPLEWFKH